MHKLENAANNVNMPLLDKGKAFYRQKKYAQAYEEFLKALPSSFIPEWLNAIELYDGLAENLFYLAASANNAKPQKMDTNAIIRYLTKVWDFASQNSKPNLAAFSAYYLGTIAHQYGNSVAAITFLSAAASHFKDYTSGDFDISNSDFAFYYSNTLFALLESYFKVKEYKKSSELIEQIKTLFQQKSECFIISKPNYMKLHLLEGFIHYYNNDLDKAIDTFVVANTEKYPQIDIMKSVDLESHYANLILYGRALCYFKKKMFDEAVQIFQLIPQISPIIALNDYTAAENNIYRDYLYAKALYKLKNFKEAYKAIQSALETQKKTDKIKKQLALELFYFASKVVSKNPEVYDLVTPIDLLEKTLSICSIDERKQAKINFLLGEDRYYSNNVGDALKHLAVTCKYYHARSQDRSSFSQKDYLLFARCLLIMGACSNIKHEFSSAKNYITIAKKIFDRLGDASKPYQLDVCLELGKACNSLKEYDKAASYLNTSAVECTSLDLKENTDDRRLLAAINQQLGLSYCRQNNFDRAKNYLKASLCIFELNDTKIEIASTAIGLALCHYQLNNISESNKYSSQALLSIQTIRNENPDDFDNRYLPVLKCWLSDYIYDKGIALISEFLKIIRANEIQEQFKGMQQDPSSINSNNIEKERLNLFTSFLKRLTSKTLQDRELRCLANLDMEVINYYNKKFAPEFGKKTPAANINLLSALQNHYSANKTFDSLPALFHKKDFITLISKFNDKSKILIEFPDAAWIQEFTCEEITGTREGVLLKFNELNPDTARQIIRVWHENPNHPKSFSAEDFELAKFIADNKPFLFAENNNSFALVNQLEELRFQVHQKNVELAKLKRNQVEMHVKNFFEQKSNNFNSDVIDLWRSLVKEYDLDERGARSELLLGILQLRWQKTGYTTIPYLLQALKKAGYSFGQMKLNSNLLEILYTCPDAVWLQDIRLEDIAYELYQKGQHVHQNTLRLMLTELDELEIKQLITIWNEENKENKAFNPHDQDYKVLKRKLLTSVDNLKNTIKKVEFYHAQLQKEIDTLKPPKTNPVHVLGFLAKRKLNPEEKVLNEKDLKDVKKVKSFSQFV